MSVFIGELKVFQQLGQCNTWYALGGNSSATAPPPPPPARPPN